VLGKEKPLGLFRGNAIDCITVIQYYYCMNRTEIIQASFIKSASKWRKLYRAGELGKKEVSRLMNHPSTRSVFRGGTKGAQPKARRILQPYDFTSEVEPVYSAYQRNSANWTPRNYKPKAEMFKHNPHPDVDDLYHYSPISSGVSNAGTRRPQLFDRTPYEASTNSFEFSDVSPNVWGHPEGRARPAYMQFSPMKETMNGRAYTNNIVSPRHPLRRATTRHEVGHYADGVRRVTYPQQAQQQNRFLHTVMRQADPIQYNSLMRTATLDLTPELNGHYLGALSGRGGKALRNATQDSWSSDYANKIRSWNTLHRQQLSQEKLDALASSVEHLRRNYSMNTGGSLSRPILP
jgi:hypothetical protein